MPTVPKKTALIVAGCIAAGTSYRLYLVLSGLPATNSDEATMGLAALHIAEGRDYPAFFYGQHYMGTLEAYLAAPLFVLFGPSLVALRLPLLPLYAVFCYLMYRLTRRLYTPRFAVLVAALLALGSASVVHGQIFAGGGYPEIRPMGAGLLLLAVWLGSRRDQPVRRRRLGFACWGLLTGLALWDDWLILPYVAGAGMALLAGCRHELRGWPSGLLAIGVVAGASPSIAHHLQNGVAQSSLSAMLHLAGSGHASIVEKIYGGVLLGVPLGTGLCAPGQCEGWPLFFGALYPLLLILAGGGASAAIGRFKRGFGGDSGERIRELGRLALVLAAAATLIAYARSGAAGQTPTTSVRYLSPLIISLPAVLWPIWSAAARLTHDRSPLNVLGGGLLAVFVVAMVIPTVALIQDAPNGRRVAGDEQALVDFLKESGDTRVYSEYWTCNRLAFASGERVVCAALTDDLRPGLDRYLPFRHQVASAPSPAYVLPIGSAVDRAFAARLRTLGVTADITEVFGYHVYRPATVVDVPIH